VEAFELWAWGDVQLAMIFHDLGRLLEHGRPLAESILEALHGELVFGVEAHCGAKFPESLYLFSAGESRVSALDVIKDQLLANEFLQGQVLNVIGNEMRGAFEFREGFVEALGVLELHATVKG
jgi:hypothetical protein